MQSIRRLSAVLGAAILLALLAVVSAPPTAADETGVDAGATFDEAILAMLEHSQAESKTVVLYVGSHTLAGVVTRIHGTDAVEIRNREVARILVRLDQVVAVGAY